MKQFIRGNDWLDTSLDVGWGNGYVAIPVSSSWHGVHYDNIPIDIHGGLTYAELASNASFKPDGIDGSDWIIGFDTAHLHDDKYSCDKDYVVNETNELFKQMVELDKSALVKTSIMVTCPHCKSSSDVTNSKDDDAYRVELASIDCQSCKNKLYFLI